MGKHEFLRATVVDSVSSIVRHTSTVTASNNELTEANSRVSARNPLIKAIDAVVDVTSSFPFAGKIWITPAVKHASRETNTHVKLVRLIKALGVIGILLPAHYYQTKLGLSALDNLIEQNIDSPSEVVRAYIDTAYIAAMGAVTLTQAKIGARQVRRFAETTYNLAKDFRSWTAQSPVTHAERLRTSLTSGNENDINSFIVFKAPKKRQEVIELAIQNNTDPALVAPLLQLQEVSERTTRRRAIKNIVGRGLRKPKSDAYYFSGKEIVVMTTVTGLGQAIFIASAHIL